MQPERLQAGLFHEGMELKKPLFEAKKSKFQKDFFDGLLTQAALGLKLFSMFQRHQIQAGSSMFITTNIAQRRKIFAEAACARSAVETLFSIQDFYPFFLHGFVIMPDHCHLLLRKMGCTPVGSVIIS